MAEDPAKVKAYHAAYHVAHREVHNARSAAYQTEHQEDHARRSTAYYAAHREECSARVIAYRLAHPEADRAYHAAHRDKRNAQTRVWSTAHPDQRREQHRKATAIRRGAPVCDHPSCLTLGASALAWQVNPHACYLCGTPVWQGVNLHMDHVMPISRGGLHCADNLRPACAPCNMRKHAKIIAA